MANFTFEIDGTDFSDFPGFIEEVNRTLSQVDGRENLWNGNLDALSDFPWAGGTFRWNNSDKSRNDLGHAAMAAWLTKNLTYCHYTNRPGVQKRLDEAEAERGKTLFDWLIEIFEENDKFIHLELS